MTLLQSYHEDSKKRRESDVWRVFVACFWHSSPTLFTAHASRTHVKAPQTDFPVKHDSSSGLTHDSPSERPLRTKVTFQPRRAPKRHRGRQAVRGPPKPSTDRLLSLPRPVGNLDQGPEAAPKPSRHPPRCPKPMDEASMASGQTPWLNATGIEAIEAKLRSVWAPKPLVLDWLPSGTRCGSQREPCYLEGSSGRVF